MIDCDCEKLKNGQGYKDNNGNIWKKDQLHKDHWDISDRHGNKIREVDFNGNEIWPILKEVVDKGNEYMTTESKDGNLIYYQKTYLDEGVKVIVRLIVGKNGEVRLSDAWGELLK